MDTLTLKKRLLILVEGCNKGYLIGQWNKPEGFYLASYYDIKNGVYLHEILNMAYDLEQTLGTLARVINILNDMKLS